jgi:hypothetical protein
MTRLLPPKLIKNIQEWAKEESKFKEGMFQGMAQGSIPKDNRGRRSLYNVALYVDLHLQGVLVNQWFVKCLVAKFEQEHEEPMEWMINCVKERWEARTKR